MTPPPSDEELADRVAELEATLDQLRREVSQPPTGPLGLPRPPTPRELLRLTDQYAIPTAIAVLEANVRALELLQRLIRLADTERVAEEEANRMRSRAEAISRVTLDQLDGALRDLQEGGLPSEPESRRIIEDARQLRTELREWLDEGDRTVADHVARERRDRDGSNELDVADDPDGPDESTDAIEIDVDEELRSIRAELEEDRRSNGDSTPENAAERETDDGAGGYDSTDDEVGADGTTGDGTTDDGMTDDGMTDDGMTDDGTTDDDSAGTEEDDQTGSNR